MIPRHLASLIHLKNINDSTTRSQIRHEPYHQDSYRVLEMYDHAKHCDTMQKAPCIRKARIGAPKKDPDFQISWRAGNAVWKVWSLGVEGQYELPYKVKALDVLTIEWSYQNRKCNKSNTQIRGKAKTRTCFLTSDSDLFTLCLLFIICSIGQGA